MKPAEMRLVLPAVIAAAAHEVRIFNRSAGKLTIHLAQHSYR